MSPEDAARTITIDARAGRDYDPDLFVLQVAFEGERDDRAACVESYNADYAKVKAALIGVGVPEEEIHNGEFRISVHYEWYYEKDTTYRYERYRRTERYVDGCEYSGSCTFGGSMDGELLAAIWAALQNLEGDFNFEIAYSLEKPDECERELLRSAVKAARDRAETLADAAGAKLGAVSSIRHRFRNATYGYVEDADYILSPMAAYDKSAAESAAPVFNPEKMNVDCEVSIAWEIAY